MKTIFENKSLRFICNSINTGLVETNEIKINDLQIISSKKPEFFIKAIEIDISEYVVNMLQKRKLFSSEVIKFETSFIDYIVFSIVGEETLIISSLFELISIAPNLLQGEQEKSESENKPILNIWSLDTDEWNLIVQN